jgi:hypothetical protein
MKNITPAKMLPKILDVQSTSLIPFTPDGKGWRPRKIVSTQ